MSQRKKTPVTKRATINVGAGHDHGLPWLRPPTRSTPDYNYWKRADTWTVKEGCFLVCGYEPEADQAWWSICHYDGGGKSEVGKLYHLAIKRFQFEDAFGLDPAEFLRWCVSKDIPIPEPLKPLLAVPAAAEEKQANSVVTPPPKKKPGRKANPERMKQDMGIYKARKAGTSYPEIAAEFGCSVGDAKAAFERARKCVGRKSM